MSYLGAPNTFRFFAVNAAVCALVYGFFQCLYVRPRKSKKRTDEGSSEEDPKTTKVEATEVNPQPLPVATSTPKASFQTESLAPAFMPAKGSNNKDSALEEGMVNTGPRSITGGTRV